MPANLHPARRRDDLPSVARLLTLSDNVVAIALTLLVFRLKVPALVADQDSAADLAAQPARKRRARVGLHCLSARRRHPAPAGSAPAREASARGSLPTVLRCLYAAGSRLPGPRHGLGLVLGDFL